MSRITTKFGRVEYVAEDVVYFPHGLIGWETCRQWLLLADAENDALGWLQSVERSEVALGLVSPRRFVPDYQVRVAGRDLEGIKCGNADDMHVLVAVGKNEAGPTLNLKAPLVFNLAEQLGSQVVALNDLPLQHPLLPSSTPLKKSA